MKSLRKGHDERVRHGKRNNRRSPDHMNRMYESELHTRCYNEPIDMCYGFLQFYPTFPHIPPGAFWGELVSS
jgi:hypothetical protein